MAQSVPERQSRLAVPELRWLLVALEDLLVLAGRRGPALPGDQEVLGYPAALVDREVLVGPEVQEGLAWLWAEE